MTPTVVDDLEELYRSIRAKSDEYKIVAGTLYFSVTAFRDIGRKPSVDRSALRTNPSEAKKSQTDGVAKMIAQEVRGICGIPVDPNKNGKGTKNYAVDVIHRPVQNQQEEPDNLAHCQIECDPSVESASRFRKVQEALALIATRHGFVIAPS